MFLLISLSSFYILIYNVFHFSPILGYDAEAHFNYVDYLSRYLPYELRLQFKRNKRVFQPTTWLSNSVNCSGILQKHNYIKWLLLDCQPIYGKATQIFQSFMYVFTILINLYTLKLFNKSKNIFNISYLILVSLLAVNYRTISMIRGEPYILFFLSLFILIIYKADNSNYDYNIKLILLAGIVIGSIALSRQWGFLLFIPLIVLLISKNSKQNYLIFWLTSSFIGALLSSWFMLVFIENMARLLLLI